jgi:Uma2 family endonuclease
MAAPVINQFDPLTEFAGVWTTSLAERYLPLPGHEYDRYECVDGRLFMSPVGVSDHSYARVVLTALMRIPARAAGLLTLGEVNMTFNDRTWVEPDAAVISGAPALGKQRTWVPTELFVLPIEFVAPSSRWRDYVKKPQLCAAVGVPYFMTVDIAHSLGPVKVTLLRLRADGKHTVLAEATSGETFTMTEPFPLAFDPAELLMP